MNKPGPTNKASLKLGKVFFPLVTKRKISLGLDHVEEITRISDKIFVWFLELSDPC